MSTPLVSQFVARHSRVSPRSSSVYFYEETIASPSRLTLEKIQVSPEASETILSALYQATGIMAIVNNHGFHYWTEQDTDEQFTATMAIVEQLLLDVVTNGCILGRDTRLRVERIGQSVAAVVTATVSA